MRAGLAAVAALVACDLRPAEERALAELDVGRATVPGLAVEIGGGLAAVRSLTGGDDASATLWSQAPSLDVTVEATAPTTLALTVLNALPDAQLTGPGAITPGAPDARPTTRTFTVSLPAGSSRWRLAAPDADLAAPFRVAAMADIQTGLPTVHEVFERIARTAGVRFVVSMGDLTERAEEAEYDLFEEQLAALPVPYYTTLGNHELWTEPANYFRRFGRASFQFEHQGVAFTFADSGDAGLDPIVHGWIDDWLAAAHDQLHLLLTHFPTVEPSGSRAGSFRSRREGQDLIARLAAAGVDLALYGHIHTLLAYEHAGIPAWISGGGGAIPEKWDGIGRHFLTIDLDAAARTADVGVVRVD